MMGVYVPIGPIISEEEMNSNSPAKHLIAMIVLSSAGLLSSSSYAFDAATAETLARQNGCFKCHSVEKKKEGPTYREVAAKYKGKADAEAKLVTELGEGKKHPKVAASEADRKTLVKWVLSQ